MSNSPKYDVQAVSIEKLLAPESVALEVPPFQRRYSWGSEEVSQLMDDLFGDEEWIKSQRDDIPYFLGSIVLAGDQDGFLVLDGQQRLTTISLLLSSLKHKLERLDHPDSSEIQKYLVSGKLGDRKKAKLKLQPEDHDLYLSFVKDPEASQDIRYRHSLLGQSLRRIGVLVDEYASRLTKHGKSAKDAYESMASRVMYNVEIVRIVAPSESEAFRLFETLNDRGLALNAADLIKNKLFAQCGNDFIDEAIDTWRETVELVGETEIVNFLRYYWIASEGDVRTRGLYDVYRDKLAQMKPIDAAVYAERVKEAAEAYQHIISPDTSTCPWGTETAEALQRLNAFRARSCRPALLACAVQRPKYMQQVTNACDSITVRYSLVGERNPNQLERSYNQLCRTIRAESENFGDDLAKALQELFPSIPVDAEFAKMFSELEITNVTSAWRTLLIRLNDFVATGETRIEGPTRVHVEHVFPRNPSGKALLESGIPSDDASTYCGKIGNLTLLSGNKNRSISNGPFSKKQPAFAVSEIGLNRWVAEQQQWGAKEIDERSSQLAALAQRAWPWPVAIQD